MSRWLPEWRTATPMRLSIGHKALVLAEDGGPVRASLSVDAGLVGASNAAHAEWAQALRALAEQGRLAPGCEMEVVVSDHWARYAMLGVPAGIARFDELRALAATRFEHLFGLSAGHWQIEADWQTRGSILACALPRALIEALNAQGWKLNSLQAHAMYLMACHASELPAQGWVACKDEAGWTLLHLQRKRPLHVRYHAMAAPDTATFARLLEAERLRCDIAVGEAVWLLGDWPAWHGEQFSGHVPCRPKPLAGAYR